MRCYTVRMMSPADQMQFEERLEALSNEQLLQLWDRLGLGLVAPDTREDTLCVEKHLLIGPLLSDIDAPQLEKAMREFENKSA
jgi:hypothetical protein